MSQNRPSSLTHDQHDSSRQESYFPYSKTLEYTELEREDAYEDKDADWHINAGEMITSIRAILKDEKSAVGDLNLETYRTKIKTAMLTTGMQEESANCIADIMERSAFYVIKSQAGSTPQQTEREYQAHYEKSSRALWNVNAAIENVLKYVNAYAIIDSQFFNPVLACHHRDGKHVSIDKDLPWTFQQTDDVQVPAVKFLVLHEIVEATLMNELALTYQQAHQVAERMERVAVIARGYVYDQYDDFMQEHINRVMDVNPKIAALVGDYAERIKRDKDGVVTNLEELVELYVKALEQHIENLLQKAKTPAQRKQVLTTFLIPSGMNSDPVKVYADMPISENKDSDADIANCAWVFASQRLYPKYVSALIAERSFDLLIANYSLFKRHESDSLKASRFSSAELQHEYDKKHGLILR